MNSLSNGGLGVRPDYRPLLSGVTKGPADPAVRGGGGAILGGRQIVV